MTYILFECYFSTKNRKIIGLYQFFKIIKRLYILNIKYMDRLKVLIFPYSKEIIIPVKKNISNKVLLIINKLKQKQEFKLTDIPNFGYQGMEFYFDELNKLFIYEEDIIYTSDNLIQLLHDPKNKINNLFLKIAFKEYPKELNYFFKVREYNKKQNKF